MQQLDNIGLLQAINDAQSRFIASNGTHEVFDGLLTRILELTESGYGFIGEVLYDSDEQPYLKTSAVTNIAWDEATRTLFEQQAPLGMEFRNLDTLFGAALTSNEPVIANDPLNDPRSGGLPEGHPDMRAFLGIPISIADKLVAMIAIANRPGGYDDSVVVFLQPLLNTIAQLIQARRTAIRQQETEVSYRELYANISDAIYIIAEDGHFIDVNRGAEEMYGYSREYLVGKTPGDVEAPDKNDFTVVNEVMAKAFAGEPQQIEFWGQRANGEAFLKDVHVYPASYMGQKVIMAVARDITEQKNAERELMLHREDLERLVSERTMQVKEQADIIDQIHDSVVSTDLDGVVTSWNQGAQRLFGYTADEAVGQHISFVYPQDQHAVLQEQVIAPLREKGVHDTEVIMQRRNGEQFFAHISLSLLRNEHGDVIGMIGYSIDITEQKKAEQRLQESEAYFSELVTNSPVVIYTCVPDGDFPATFISENVRDMMGFEPQQFLDDPGFWASNIHPDDAPHVFEELGQLFEHNTHSHEYRFRLNDGNYIWVHDELKLLRNEAGMPYSIIGYWADISEMKQAEIALQQAKQEAERANRAKSEFLANMSHELRTPMHSVLSFSKLGMRRHKDIGPEKAGEFFASIHDSGTRLMALLNDLLDLAKLEAGKMELDYEQVDLWQLTESCLQDLAMQIEEQGQHYDLVNNANDARIVCDKQRIYQVIMNIVTNAIHYGPKSGSIMVTIERREAAGQPVLRLGIADEGPGLPEDEIDAVFDKFVQSSKTKTGAGGTGLGLSICKEIIDLHQGKIRAENRSQGGALFSFDIPVTPPGE